MQDPQPIFSILFALSKQPDSIIAEKSRQLLLYLPTIPRQLDKDCLHFANYNDFEVYYRLIEVVKYFSRVTEDRLSEELMQKGLTQSHVYNLSSKYLFSSNIYESKSYKCLQTLTKIINKPKQSHQ